MGYASDEYVIFSHEDVDECASDTDNCQHNCHNNVGSYTCTCMSGYRLNSDGRQCDGKQVRKSIPVLILLYLT